PGEPRDGQGVALRDPRPSQQADHLRGYQHPARGDRHPGGDVLRRDVDHPGGAGLVDVGQTLAHQNSSSSGNTVTVSPGSTQVTDSWTTISASDSARSPI